MKPALALWLLPALDFAAVQLLLLLCPLLQLREPLAITWISSLARLGLLAVTAQAVCAAWGLPAWLQRQVLLLCLTLLSLLLPCYATLISFIDPRATAELLCGWGRWDVLAFTYLITVVAAVLWHHFSPFEGESETKEQSSASLGKLLSCISPYAGRFLVVAVLVVVSSLGEMAIPHYTGRMTDWILNEENPSAFGTAILIMSLLTIGSAVTEFICDCLYNITMSLVHMGIQSRVFQSVLRQELAFFDTLQTGDITSRITADTQEMSESLSSKLSLVMWYLMMAVFLFASMLWLSWKLSLFTLLGLPVIMVIPKLSGTFYQELSFQVQASLARANQAASETLANMKTVRSFAAEEEEAERYSERLSETYLLNKKEAVAYAGFMWTNSLSGLALKVGILYYGGRLVTAGYVSSGDLVAFVLYELQFTPAMEVLLRMYPDVKKAVGASEKIFEYMHRSPRIAATGSLAPETLEGHVTFQNVSFSYPSRPGTPVLKDVSFQLRPGEVTALVGPSAAGKSTCVWLLERFYQPQEGGILLDGKSIWEYEQKYFHSKVALVSQEPVLFARSVQENISYGLGEVALDDVKAAAKCASADGFISDLNKGYQTDAGEKGGQLSVGQKQRVAIARALLRDPQILILDDATSSLDMETEHLVQTAVYNGFRHRTVLVIAHRLSTAERADRILVLEGGQVTEDGTHQELLEKKGSYSRMVQKHEQGFQRDPVKGEE
ncbi:antigen peptide transporter 1-like isoform X1 [Rhinatrema bivittatum]|uniref:antigen peptide transporter 1-like isoform X1 n=1 Tax=Rhinatrema bivittatum TaxID=194408 RepID=UPI00112B053F|nr:antigen peptide transporter 1-like isoform X1 [Rhinatrema bivittatum]XP_029441884.1 antigen peptide transporter 1-like isoform X1 [Rhinatrema bivittatum]XP_029441885.1 antigen peptide transporter 1-like isoform X1 [Rhinatrema bivittatum]